MAVRANWHEDATVAPQGVDPFMLASSVSMPTIPIDTDSQELYERLTTLIRHESRLFNKGVTCAVKDKPDTCCCACPLNQAGGDTDHAFLCRVGVEQEQVVTLLAAQEQRAD